MNPIHILAAGEGDPPADLDAVAEARPQERPVPPGGDGPVRLDKARPAPVGRDPLETIKHHDVRAELIVEGVGVLDAQVHRHSGLPRGHLEGEAEAIA